MGACSLSAASMAAPSNGPASFRIWARAASRTESGGPGCGSGGGEASPPPIRARTSRPNIGSASLERRDQEEGRFAGSVEVDLVVEAVGLTVVEKDEETPARERPFGLGNQRL